MDFSSCSDPCYFPVIVALDYSGLYRFRDFNALAGFWIFGKEKLDLSMFARWMVKEYFGKESNYLPFSQKDYCSAEHTLSGDISRAPFPLFLLVNYNSVFQTFLKILSLALVPMEALF